MNAFSACHSRVRSCFTRQEDKKMTMTDADFTATLTAYLAQFSEGHQPIVPLFRNDDGSIDRDKTLALPCYLNLART